MTTPNIPDLPYDLATDGDGRVLQLKEAPETGYYIRATHPRVGGIAVRVDPADLIRELAHFVPIPAEPQKVISAWLARVAPGFVVLADDLLTTLAAAGLLVGPGGPAASEGEPVAWLEENDGSVWARDSVTGQFVNPWLQGGSTASTVEELAEKHGPLTPLYAHPPVTAEPATAPSVTDASVDNSDATVSAPSVEQIAEVHTYHGCNGHYDGTRVECLGCNWSEDVRPGTPLADVHARHVAEEIRALWSPAPGDADEVQWIGRGSNEYGLLEAENERLRAALEAAEALGWAQENLRANDAAMKAAQDGFSEAYNLRQKRKDEYGAARAAVEADTTEEA